MSENILRNLRPISNRTKQELIDDQFIPIDDRTQQELEDEDYLSYENESEVENIDLISAWDNKKKLYQNQVQLLNCLQTTTKKLKQETK